MKKAVIVVGGIQHLVSEGDVLEVNLLNTDKKTVSFTPLMLIDGKDIAVGTPELSESSVSASIVDPRIQADKVMAIRYKAKKRVHKVRGHRQQQTRIKISKIS